jgi:hypothetical protein
MLVPSVTRSVLVVFAVLAIGRPGWARSNGAAGDHRGQRSAGASLAARFNPPAACQWFFGNGRSHELNRERRLHLLEAVERSDTDFWVLQRGDWTLPEPATVEYLTVVKTYSPSSAAPMAAVRLDVPGHVSSCKAGWYLIQADDNLGPDTRVLAILDGVVLIEWLGQLRYLSTPDAAPPEWRMAWEAPFTVAHPETSSSAGSRPSVRWNR